MALTGVIPPPPGGVNQTFKYGQQGEITYKPNWGQPVVDGQWRGAQPQTPEQQLATADPREILQRQEESELSQLQEVLSQSEEALTRESKYKLSALEDEYGLKLEQLQRKYTVAVPAEKRQEHQQRLQTELDSLNTNHEIAKRRVFGKIQPDLDALKTQGQQFMQKKQQEYQAKLFKLDVIDELERNGTIVDPQAAQQERLQVAGISLPITGLREPRMNLDLELTRTSSIISALEKRIEQPFHFNPITGQMEQEDVDRLTEMKQQYIMYRDEFLLPQLMPQYREIYQRAKLGTAAERARRGKTPTLPATGEPIQTVGTIVEQAKPKFQSTKQKADPLGIR